MLKIRLPPDVRTVHMVGDRLCCEAIKWSDALDLTNKDLPQYVVRVRIFEQDFDLRSCDPSRRSLRRLSTLVRQISWEISVLVVSLCRVCRLAG